MILLEPENLFRSFSILPLSGVGVKGILSPILHNLSIGDSFFEDFVDVVVPVILEH